MFPSKQVIDDVLNSPLYKQAFEAFKSGDQKKGRELLYQLQKSDKMAEIEKFYKGNDTQIDGKLKSQGFGMISKNQPIPKGYNRNSFSEKTCISTQQKDLPEWENISAIVEYKEEQVYEDHYALEFTTMNMLYSIRKDNPEPFIAKIKSSASSTNTLGKLNKNCLHMIIDTLYVELSDVDYSVIEIINFFINPKKHEYLKEVIITHSDRSYSVDEIKQLKLLFNKSSWERLKFNGNFELNR